MRFIVGSAVIAAILYFVFFNTSGFSDADIVSIKATIKTEFEKNSGVSVSDVTLLRETSTKLNGFVKLKHSLLGDLTKSCTATMGQDGRNYIWRCE